jgi:ATP-binding protein involved in chromosome partitioning
LAFAQKGLRSGVLDTDIFGPSIPTLLGICEEPNLSSNNNLIPLSTYGIKSMSMGYLVPEDSPIVWRGLMVMKALKQLLHEVEWGGLDVLVLDLPPGTGDVQLTITQQVELDGAIIISTPQSLSLKDSIRGVNMFRKVNIPILGMVQNMSLYQCTNCGHQEHIFGLDGVKKACKELDIRFLADIPLHTSISSDADSGKPTVVRDSKSPQAQSFVQLADDISSTIGID